MASAEELRAMRRALELADAGLATTSPNPSVGAVVLSADGVVVGQGRTAPPPGPHAEVVALAAAGSAARGGTAVVTLEPCAHTGRTGPCTQALLDAGVARVVYALADPHPVAAGGAAVLRAAGVQVEAGVEAARAAEVLEAWLFALRASRPFVTLKLAGSVDGRAAAADGTSQWITSAQSREDAHRVRERSDAILAGVGTVLADDPQLTARHPDGRLRDHQPLRVVLDGSGRTPTEARVRDGAAPTLVLTRADLDPDPAGRLRPADVLTLLHERGVRGLLVEGGPTVAGSFLAAGLVDRLVTYLAPVVLGADALACVGPAGVATLADAPRLRVESVRRLGPDVRLDLRPVRGAGAEHEGSV